MLNVFRLTILMIVQIFAVVTNDYKILTFIQPFVFLSHFFLCFFIISYTIYNEFLSFTRINFYYYSHQKIVAFGYSAGYLRINS